MTGEAEGGSNTSQVREEDLEVVRQKAKARLEELVRSIQQEEEGKEDDEEKQPNGHEDDDDGEREITALTTRRRRFFDEYGFLHVKQFASYQDEVLPMKNQMKEWVEEMWDVPVVEEDEEDGTDEGVKSDEELAKKKKKKLAVFRTDEEQEKAQGSNDYFLDSANKVHFFAEKDAMEGDTGCLKREFATNKIGALNKAGHGMHMTPGSIFHKYTTSSNVRRLVEEMGWYDPVVPQSMYIAKQPRIGGEVTSHQDSTFLYTTPRQTCLGLWLALDDSTLVNGCLWVRPGSHREGVRRKFVRNPEHFGNVKEGIEGDPRTPFMVFEQLQDDEVMKAVPWEGKLPRNSWPPPCDGLLEAGFIPVECKAGDLLVFPGQLDHLSLPNCSALERHTFQLHLVEGPSAGVTWSETNWLQYPDGTPFLRLKDWSSG